MSRHRAEDPVVRKWVFLLGKVTPRLGGPAQTVGGYVQGLSEIGDKGFVAGIGRQQVIADVIGIPSSSVVGSFEGGAWSLTRQLLRFCFGVTRDANLVVVGVWHIPYFAAALTGIAFRVVGRPQVGLRICVPTMSLLEYDLPGGWRKRLLRPAVALSQVGFDAAVFASNGEMKNSAPRVWRTREVQAQPVTATVVGPSDQDVLNAERPISVLFAGRLHERKDLELFLTSCALTRRDRIVVIGDGEPEFVVRCKATAVSLGMESTVEWLGWQSHDETLRYMLRSKVVMVTSVDENFCHVAIEALTRGARVVMVDRILSSGDFRMLPGVTVCRATAEAVSAAVRKLHDEWDTHPSSECVAGIRAAQQLSAPTVAATGMRTIASSLI